MQLFSMFFIAERKSDKCRLYNFSRIKKNRKWLKVEFFLVTVYCNSEVSVDLLTRDTNDLSQKY